MPIPRGHDLEGIEGLHAPLHELVAFLVALEFERHVLLERLGGAEIVDLHRMVHHQVHRYQRLDQLRVLAHLLRNRAHCSQIGEYRDASEVLQHDPREHERDLIGPCRVRFPVRELANMFLGDLLAVAIAQHRLEHDPDRYRQARHLDAERLFQGGQAVEMAGLARFEWKFLVGIEQIVRHGVLRTGLGGRDRVRSL